MHMNQNVGYATTFVVALAIVLYWRKPKIATLIVVVAQFLPVFLLSWTVEPYVGRAAWMYGSIALAALVFCGCTAQLALTEARRKNSGPVV